MVICVRFDIMYIEVKERNIKHFSVLKCDKKESEVSSNEIFNL